MTLNPCPSIALPRESMKHISDMLKACQKAPKEVDLSWSLHQNLRDSVAPSVKTMPVNSVNYTWDYLTYRYIVHLELE